MEGTPEGVVEGTPEGVVEGTPEGVVEGEGEGVVEMVEVPYVVGLDEVSATTAILEVGLQVGVVTYVCDDVVPAGYVIDQSPEGGTTVEIGSSVDLWVSTGPCPPEGEGTPEGVPEGVVEGTPEGTPEGVPEGVVEGEGMPEGEGEGEVYAIVPYVIGMDLSSANSEIVEAGLVAGNVYEVCSDDYPYGYVVAQQPDAGNTAELGSAVDLWVSCGPCVDVPNVVGETQSQAISDLQSAGLEVGSIIPVCDNDLPAGYVVAQNPPPTTESTCFLPNTSSIPVDLYVACGPCTTIPDVTGLQQTVAISTLTSYGLLVDDIISVCDNDLPVGTVLAQDPTAVSNTCILPNTTAVPVDLYVVCGPCYPIQFPYVEGNTESMAVSILTSNGFNVDDIIYVCSDTVPAGYVISQYPPSDPNTPPVINTCNLDVDLTVSTGPC